LSVEDIYNVHHLQSEIRNTLLKRKFQN
jgi:hypothetical protein